MVKEIESLENFQTLAKSGKAVIFYFWAVWCGPCKLLTPIFEKLAKETAELTSEVEFYKVDIDEQDEVGLEAEIKSMPTTMMYKDGVEIDRFIGAIPRKLEALIAKGITLTKDGPQQQEVQHPEVEAKQSEIPPDPQQPDVHKPDVHQPDIQQPDDQEPDVQKPDAQSFDVQRPEAQQSETQLPEVAQFEAGEQLESREVKAD